MPERTRTRRNKRGIRRCTARACAAAVALAMLGSHAAIRAQEVAPFRLTGIDGYASIRYLNEEFDSLQPGARVRQGLSDVRQEVFLMTHGYIYHPNFLTLDIGGGPVLQRSRYVSDAPDVASSSSRYNLTARASLLRDKPYRGTLFYEKLNPTLTVSPASVMTQENTRYGFDLALLAPIAVSIDAVRFRAQGRSTELVVDTQTDQVNLRASQPLGSHGLAQFRHQASTQSALNGSPNLPIQRTDIDRRNTQLDARLSFGPGEKYSMYSLLAFDAQAYATSRKDLPGRKERRVLLDLRSRESERLNAFATYSSTSTDQEIYYVDVNSGSAGFTYEPAKDVLLRGAARADDSRSTQLAVQSVGVDGSAQLKTPLGPGVLTSSYAVRYDRRDQEARASRVDVIGESLTLAGTALLLLSRPRVVAGSIVVSNATRTQTFVEGFDYAVSIVGVQARLQRLVGGNITDGQEVVVDYAFDPGGTYAATQWDQTLNIDWALGNHVNLYVRHFRAAPQVTSGSPTAPLNAVRSTLFGGRADVPLKGTLDLVLGGLYQHELRRETISPFRRRQLDAYAQSRIPWVDGSDVRISGRRVETEFDNSLEDVRLVGWDLSIRTRHSPGVDVTATGSYERDTGSPITRTRLLGTGRLQWRHRSVAFSLDLTRSREAQDGYRRNRTLAQAQLRRDF